MKRSEEAQREMDFAVGLRPNDGNVPYNCACINCKLGRKAEALTVIRKAWDAGGRDPVWTRRDPDLAILHGDPEFEKLFPPERA